MPATATMTTPGMRTTAPRIRLDPSTLNAVYVPHLRNFHRTQIYYGGSSSGKSNFEAARAVLDVLQGRNYLVARNVAKTIRGSCWNEVLKAIDRMKLTAYFKINQSDLYITAKNNGCQILFTGLDDVEKVKSITPAHGVLTDIWVEEATEISRDSYMQLKKRLRGPSKHKKRFTLTFNPVYVGHWIYKEFFGIWNDRETYAATDKLSILKTTYLDNRFLDPDDRAELEDETDPYYKDVYTLGNWGVLGDLIFKNWHTDDLAEFAKSADNLSHGLDFGFASDPCGALKVHLDRMHKKIYVFDEIHEYGLTNTALAGLLKPFVGQQYITCDSAEPKSITELQQLGMPHASRVDRRQAFVVYDATVEQAPLFGVYWLPRLDEDGKKDGLRSWVYTSTHIIPFEGVDLDNLQEVMADAARGITGRQEHFFGAVPLIEYWNNPQMTGDFEKVMSLIDAYNVLQSDRINDKSQFVDAILVLIGVTGGIVPAADPTDKRTPAQRLRDDRLLNLPPNAKAEWLAKQLDEADVEVLKNAIKSDIHKFSQVPDLTDEEFAGQASGVAMRYKLLGLEQLTKVKERWFREGLRWRRRCFCSALNTKGAIDATDPDAIEETFTRSLPVNEVEIAQMVKDLQGIVPDEILLKQVPFVSDVQKALAMLAQQKADAAELQKKAFGDYPDANKNGGAAGQEGEPGTEPGKTGTPAGKSGTKAGKNSGAGKEE